MMAADCCFTTKKDIKRTRSAKKKIGIKTKFPIIIDLVNDLKISVSNWSEFLPVCYTLFLYNFGELRQYIKIIGLKQSEFCLDFLLSQAKIEYQINVAL